MVEGIDKWEGRCAVECSSIIQGGGDAHRCLVDIWDAEIDFSHDGVGGPHNHGERGGCLVK